MQWVNSCVCVGQNRKNMKFKEDFNLIFLNFKLALSNMYYRICCFCWVEGRKLLLVHWAKTLGSYEVLSWQLNNVGLFANNAHTYTCLTWNLYILFSWEEKQNILLWLQYSHSPTWLAFTVCKLNIIWYQVSYRNILRNI